MAELNYRTENGVLTAVGSYREYDSSTDFDGSPTLFHFPDNHEEQDQTTFEIRYAGSFSGSNLRRFSYFDQQMFVGERRDFGVVDIAQRTVKTYMIADSTKLTVGARWTEETKDVLFNAIGSCQLDFSSCAGPSSGLIQGGSWNDTTPKVAITQYINENVNVYASFTQGFRSGSFDARARTIDSFLNSRPGPEEVTSYELGLKSLLNDGRILLNVAVFRSDYDDIQKLALEECEVDLATCPSGRIQIINAAKATIDGVEVEAAFYVTDQFNINASLGYTDATLTSSKGLTPMERRAMTLYLIHSQRLSSSESRSPIT